MVDAIIKKKEARGAESVFTEITLPGKDPIGALFSGDVAGETWKSNTDGGVYAVDIVVVHAGAYYNNLTGTNTDTTPNVDDTNWEKISSGGGITLTRGEAVQSVSPAALGTGFTVITGAQVVLPAAGTYRLFYNGRAQVTGVSEFIVFRMFNVTGGAVVPDTVGIAEFDSGSVGNKQATVSVEQPEFTVTAPTTIRLEARSNVTGNTSLNDTNGVTKIGFQQLPETVAVALQAADIGGTIATNDSQKPAQNILTPIKFNVSENLVGIAFTPGTNQENIPMPSAGFLNIDSEFHFERQSSGGILNFHALVEKDTGGSGTFIRIGRLGHKPLGTGVHDNFAKSIKNIPVAVGDQVRVIQRTDGAPADGIGILHGAPGFASPIENAGCVLHLTLHKSVEVNKVFTFNDPITVPVVADGTIAAGDVLTFAAGTPGRVIRTTTASNERILGVALAGAVAGGTLRMVIGNEFTVNVNNTVAVGNFLRSSAVAGRAESSGTGGVPGDFAIAMTAGVAGGTVQARFGKAERF